MERTVGRRVVRLVLPHQLFEQHLTAQPGTHFILVEDDLFFRQYHFHSHKLVLHRAGMKAFAVRLQEAGLSLTYVESGEQSSSSGLSEVLSDLRPTDVQVYDVVDDWLLRDLTSAMADAGYRPKPSDIADSPNFLTTRTDMANLPAGAARRMQHFYRWQRQRLDVLLTDGEPLGGQWSFDEDNRKKFPRGHVPPEVTPAPPTTEVREAIDWVAERFPDAPGDPRTFAWPTTHEQAAAGLDEFLTTRFDLFGPYEDAMSATEPFGYHSLLTPSLNIGLLDPQQILTRALEVGEQRSISLPSLEGFVRQLIGWREYMRLTYVRHGRTMRTTNHLGHHAGLPSGWWTAETGLEPVDVVLRRVLDRGYAHHIERLMVLANAMCLLRIHPDAAYRWFMEMFVDAYDWVMVPNVYAMSQFAAGSTITTKPYVSGSNYLRKMSDFPSGEWVGDWDGLYWSFVNDHREVFASNPRSQMMVSLLERMPEEKRLGHFERAAPWLA